MLIGQTVMMTVEELHQTTYCSSTLHSNHKYALYLRLNRNEITGVIQYNLPCLERMGSVETALTRSFIGRTNTILEMGKWSIYSPGLRFTKAL